MIHDMSKRKNIPADPNRKVPVREFQKLLKNLRTGRLGVTRQRVFKMIKDGLIQGWEKDPIFDHVLIPVSEAKRLNSMGREDGKRLSEIEESAVACR